ncbi:sushi domain-containing protein 4-like [Physella acuta]|uniref:sushi domain-containing protein 4-like n=1 Tax=Physella acuta TaxID=109671 RepID=UPI0027DC4689|nr:sushi domain-containing protein 4-like [Physella acuta]XP_059170445.1 sushi domain-containing protein 4-like [Physella acuta]XP_059170446.1 sushi domain-containing protein 4-like [Physella acuta]
MMAVVLRIVSILMCVVYLLDRAFSIDDQNCPPVAPIENGYMDIDFLMPPYFQRSNYKCNVGYRLVGNNTAICLNGNWTPSEPPSCVPEAECSSNPLVPNAVVDYIGKDFTKSRARVVCESGFAVENTFQTSYEIVCDAGGHWTAVDGRANLPSCVNNHCPSPPDIPGAQHRFTEYAQIMLEGTVVEYKCSRGFIPVVPYNAHLICHRGQWVGQVPSCEAVESSRYCQDIDQIKNGFCKCIGEDTADLSLCKPFRPGIKIECTCLQGYKLQGVDVLTCSQNIQTNTGEWDWKQPICYSGNEIDLIPDGQNDGKSYSSGDISDSKNKGSSLVIVITTACSVLGVLLLIMVIVVMRRKKSRPHLFQQGPVPPPYARVQSNYLDEHDRMALMAYADASGIHLPSYEEAVRPGGGNTPVGAGLPGVGHSTSPTTSEYRRLPSVHNGMRAGGMHQQNFGGDGNNNINNNNNNNSNRHSTVTTSTMNRDGVSEIFGSRDTVNVSMSDASTSVTVETFDSGTSNRSISSQRATAGSLNSSDDQLANVNDDAPLLDSSSQREVDVVSMSSNPSHTSKEDQ